MSDPTGNYRHLSAIAADCCPASLFDDGRQRPLGAVAENYQVVPNDHPFARVFIDMHESSSDSVSRLHSALERAMRDYQPLHSQAAMLESFKPIIIGFRVKRASYRAIRDLLGEHGIRVSEQAVIRFCRKYSTEIKRLSQGAQASIPTEAPRSESNLPTSSDASTTTNLHSSSEPQKKMRSLRGPV
jgi:hypothetical protein